MTDGPSIPDSDFYPVVFRTADPNLEVVYIAGEWCIFAKEREPVTDLEHLDRVRLERHANDLRDMITALCSVMTAEQRDQGLDKWRAGREAADAADWPAHQTKGNQ